MWAHFNAAMGSVWHSWVWSPFSHIQLFETAWTVAHQAPLSMGFTRQEHWSGLWFPPPGSVSHPGIELGFSALADGFFPTSITWEAQCLASLTANKKSVRAAMLTRMLRMSRIMQVWKMHSVPSKRQRTITKQKMDWKKVVYSIME